MDIPMTEPKPRPQKVDLSDEKVHWDLGTSQSYAEYLQLDKLLDAQKPNSFEHDEMMFIIVHQTSELWMRLFLHELDSVFEFVRRDNLDPSFKCLSRISQVQAQMLAVWDILSTMTPYDYSAFRNTLGRSSGFQSPQYRMLEFLLGNKNADMLPVFEHAPAQRARLAAVLHAPSLYDEFLRHLGRSGHAIPDHCLERDFALPHQREPELIPVLQRIYEQPDQYWSEYHLCEQLVDVEESFQLWRFRHMKTVERVIGYKRGTGGSSGVAFLKRALELTFFPELLEVRTALGSKG